MKKINTDLREIYILLQDAYILFENIYCNILNFEKKKLFANLNF